MTLLSHAASIYTLVSALGGMVRRHKSQGQQRAGHKNGVKPPIEEVELYVAS